MQSLRHYLDLLNPEAAFYFIFSPAAPTAYRSSQARGQIRAAAAGLPRSHSHTRSELHL